MTTKKPLGLVAIAVYCAFSGCILLLVGFLALFASQIPEGGGLFTAIGVLFSALGVFLLVAVYGLWSFQAWGKTLAIWLAIVSILLGILAILPILPDQKFTVGNTILQIIGIGVNLIIIRYLRQERVAALFALEQ